MFEGFHSYRRFRARMQLLLAVPPSRFDAPATTGALRDAIRELSDAGYPTTAIREMMLSGVERMVRDNCGSAGQRDALLYWIEASIDDERLFKIRRRDEAPPVTTPKEQEEETW